MAGLSLAHEAGATSPTCKSVQLLDSSVLNGSRDVPRDARMLVEYTACGTPAVTLVRDGVVVDAEIVHGRTGRGSTWSSVKPRAPLEGDAAYVLTIRQDESVSTTLQFTAGDVLSEEQTAKPSLRPVTSTFASHTNEAGLATASFELELRPSKSVPGGVAYLEGRTLDATGMFFTNALAFDDGSGPVRLSTSRQVRPGEPTCFSFVYEDGAGRLSEPSDAQCVTVPGTPPEPPPASEGGCATAPGASGSPWLAFLAFASLGAIRRARRSRRR